MGGRWRQACWADLMKSDPTPDGLDKSHPPNTRNPQTGQGRRMKSRYVPSPKHARGEIAIKAALPHSLPGFRGRIRFPDQSIPSSDLRDSSKSEAVGFD